MLPTDPALLVNILAPETAMHLTQDQRQALTEIIGPDLERLTETLTTIAQIAQHNISDLTRAGEVGKAIREAAIVARSHEASP